MQNTRKTNKYNRRIQKTQTGGKKSTTKSIHPVHTAFFVVSFFLTQTGQLLMINVSCQVTFIHIQSLFASLQMYFCQLCVAAVSRVQASELPERYKELRFLCVNRFTVVIKSNRKVSWWSCGCSFSSSEHKTRIYLKDWLYSEVAHTGALWTLMYTNRYWISLGQM